MDALVNEFPRFLEGFFGTLRISLFAAVGALLIGTLLAGFRVSPVPPLRWIGTAWVTVFRNSPLVVMLFMFAFALPEVGVRFPTFGGNAFFWPGVTALTSTPPRSSARRCAPASTPSHRARPRRPARSG